MYNYQHILIATDSCEVDTPVFQRAMVIYDWCKPKVTIMHILENAPADIPADVAPPEGEDKFGWMKDKAFQTLKENCVKLAIHDINLMVELGLAKPAIVDAAKSLGVDLIIVGAHERHGLAVLTPSTTDGIIHAAPCDVLAVHSEKH